MLQMIREFLIFLVFVATLYSRGGGVLLLSTGKLSDGKLDNVVNDMPRGWSIYYSWVAPDGRELKHHLKNVKRKFIEASNLKHPLITVIYDPKDYDNFMFFMPSVFLEICISKKQYEKLKNLPCTREKIND